MGIINTLYTIQCLYVDNTNTAKFNKMSGDIRCASDQCIIADLADLYYVIGNKTVSALDQLQSCLAFTNTALAHDQNTFTKYVKEYTVDTDTWCQLYI